jgi:hypothetical protein
MGYQETFVPRDPHRIYVRDHQNTKVSFTIPDEPIFHSASTSWTSVGSDAGSPEPIRRPSPATGHKAEILDVYDLYLGYDAKNFRISRPNGG